MAVSRLRLYDVLNSRLPQAIGLSPSDTASVAAAVNPAQERLITCPEAGDTGWYGGYAEMTFNVTQNSPNITVPRGVARIIKVNPCNWPMRIQNQFYEYLDFGSGNWPKLTCDGSDSNRCRQGPYMALERNTVCTFTDLTVPNQRLRIYPTSSADKNLRVLVGCHDVNNQKVSGLDGTVLVQGAFAVLDTPFVDLYYPNTTIPIELTSIDSIQKDVTLGPVSFYQVDITTGAQVLLLTMEPSETIAAYARYRLNSIPDGCCWNPAQDGNGQVQVNAMVKLDLVPATTPTDYLLIQSIEALLAECQAGRFADMDSVTAKTEAQERHKKAVGLLNGQLNHYEGRQTPAVRLSPWGWDRLSRQSIGSLR